MPEGDHSRTIRSPWADPPGPGQAIEVAEGILWLRLPLPMKLDHVNVYALDEGDGWTVIDTGFDSRRSRAEWEALLAGPLAGRPVTRVVVTHYHPDHVGLAGWFRSRGAALHTTRLSWTLARMLTLDVQPRPTPEALAFYRRAGMPGDMLAARAAERPFNFADCVAPLPPGFLGIVEGDEIALGGRTWRVRLGHGHAPDHATFWEVGGDLVLGGDQLLPSISPNISVYPNEPEADPLADWLESCARLAPHATEDQLVLPGHKLPYRGLPLRLDQLAGNHLSALDRLRAHLAEPHRATDCFLPVFRREIGGAEYGMALGEALAHLNHLHHKGEAVRWMDPDGAWRWRMA